MDSNNLSFFIHCRVAKAVQWRILCTLETAYVIFGQKYYPLSNQSALTASSKNPILLPPDHYFTELLIKERHKMVHHDGIRETLSAVRETHWIPRGRAAVKGLFVVALFVKDLKEDPIHLR